MKQIAYIQSLHLVGDVRCHITPPVPKTVQTVPKVHVRGLPSPLTLAPPYCVYLSLDAPGLNRGVDFENVAEEVYSGPRRLDHVDSEQKDT